MKNRKKLFIKKKLQVLKILSDIAETTFRSRKSSLARINASGFSDEGKEKLKESIIKPLDDNLDYLSKQVSNTNIFTILVLLQFQYTLVQTLQMSIFYYLHHHRLR